MAYQFTNPIRYYKANDPYYYEVDNIPLRQLEENVLYLKDIVTGTSNPGGILTTKSELDLKNIKQLRPTLLGSRGIKVNAGWFNARINDAYSTSQPLLNLLNLGDPQGGGPNIINNIEQAWTAEQRDAVWNSFITGGDSPYNMNGLEITYTFHQSPGGLGGNWGVAIDKDPNAGGAGYGRGLSYPKYKSANRTPWPLQNVTTLTPANLANIFGIKLKDSASYSYFNLQDIHLAFVKVWRSPFRTAVVDFPESSIQIPAFNKHDYFYYDDKGNPISLNDDADQRIDLLVAYSVPIDSSGATLANYSDTWCATGSDPIPRFINSPQLGLIRGAGIGISRGRGRPYVGDVIVTRDECDISTKIGGITPGDPKILANINDTAITANQGLSNKNNIKVHGSFPSPDDLVNMAPILALGAGDELSNDDRFQLIGQTALPLAYIVVTKGQVALTEADILDIRPFMRTAELSYNERAGVAAANPPLSLANPAVGAYQLQNVIDELGPHTPPSPVADGKVIYADYIQGGLAYGVEGTLLTMCDQDTQASNDPWGKQTLDTTDYKDANTGLSHSFAGFKSSKIYLDTIDTGKREALLEYFYRLRQSDLKKWLSDPGQSGNGYNYLGFPTERNISLFPEWDVPMDAQTFVRVSKNTAKCTWWMWIEGVDAYRPYSYVPGAIPSLDPSQPSAYLDKQYRPGMGRPGPSKWGRDGIEMKGLPYFAITCSKKFEITLPGWCTDYDVMADYSQCIPFTASHFALPNSGSTATAGIHISKGPVINVNGQNKAVFTINSTSNPLPAIGSWGWRGAFGGKDQAGMMDAGKLMDESVKGSDWQESPMGHRLYQWLSYSIITPQNEQTKYGTGRQMGSYQGKKRSLPKIGASYYPTVGFKIIGFEENPILNNLTGTSTLAQTGTYIPTTTLGASHDNITGSYCPVYPKSYIDVSKA